MLNAHSLARLVVKDLESFFFYSSKFKIKLELNSNALQHASVKGSGKNARICLSRDFCNFKVESLEDVFFICIILGHELAHYLNKHNNHIDKEPIDFTSIEIWADFFGARIFWCVVNFGKKTQFIVSKYLIEAKPELKFETLGTALGRIYNTIYKPTTDKRYPIAIERVQIFSAGIASYYYRLYEGKLPEWIPTILVIIMNETGLIDSIVENEPNWEVHDALTQRSSEIHRKIQNSNAVITSGLKPQYSNLLFTSYQVSEREYKYKKYRLEQAVNNLGLSL